MPLQKQYWEMTFGQAGRNKRIDEKVLESPNLSELINGEITSPGRIQKRHGYVSVEDDQTDDYGFSTGTRGNREGALVAIDNYAITDYNSTTEWTNDATSLLATSAVRTLLSDVKHSYSNVDIAYYNDYYYITATKTAGGISRGYLYVFDSNFVLINTELITLTSNVIKPVVYNSTVVIFENTGTGYIYANIIDQSDQTIDSYVASITNADTTDLLYDVTVNSTYAYVVYSTNAGGIGIAKIDNTGTSLGSTGTSGHGTADGAIAVHYNSVTDSILLVYSNTSNGVYYVIFTTSPSVSTSGTVDSGYYDAENIAIGTWTSFVVFVQRPGAVTSDTFITIYAISSSYVYEKSKMFNCGLAHKPVGSYIDDTTTPLLGICSSIENFNVFYTVQIKSDYSASFYPLRAEPVAKYMYRMNSAIGGGDSPSGSVSNCVGTDSYTYHFVATDVSGNVAICTLSYGVTGEPFQRRFHSVTLGSSVLISGSIPLVWDGLVAREIGFSHPPEIIDDTVGSSGSMADGDYNFVVIYKIADNNGREYFSQVSTPYSVNVSGGSGTADVEIEFTASIHRPDWDSNQDEKRLVIAYLYRTVDGPGSIYYESAKITAMTEHAWFSDSTIIATLTSGQSDSNLSDNPLLYTTGEILERCAPPPLDHICLYDNRVWGIDSETGDIPYSAEIIEGEGPWFNSAFVVSNPVDKNKPVALVDTQSFLMVFYRDAIGAIYGQGYNDLGTDGNLTGVKILVNNLGCSDQKSIIKTPVGVVFKAQSGFHLMGYDGSTPQYIGGGVSDYDSSTVVSADLIQDKKQVRFVLTGADEPILIYNYEYNQWYAWGYDVGGTWCTKSGGTVIDNVHYIVNADTGNTLAQDAGYLDGVITDSVYSEEDYTLSLTTPWIKLTGLQGFQRILKAWILGTFESDHDMTVEIDYDYDDSNTDTVTITDLSTEIGEDLYQVRIGIPNQRCQAIRFKITIDTSSYDEGAGATLTGLRLEYMVKRGAMRSPNYG